jgi:methylated-DNA-[protein]-cysteine S-methyltransferase
LVQDLKKELQMKDHESFQVTAIHSIIGDIGLVWTAEDGHFQLLEIKLPDGEIKRSRKKSRSPESIPREVQDIAGIILAGLEGIDGNVPSRTVAWREFGNFRRKVYEAVRRIPRGKVASYGNIADRVGAPGAGRAVGRAMATNPFPLLIPCHRVVHVNGSLGGFGGGLPMKRMLLKIEGVPIDSNGRVVPEAFWL